MSIENNPLVKQSPHKYGAVPFDEIKQKHFIPALEYAIKDAERILDEVKNNTDTPTFENTALKMETCSELMGTIAHTYFNLMSAESDNNFKELAQQISPKLSAFSNNIHLDSKLFEKVKHIYENMDTENLNTEQKRLVSESYKGFTLNGALLNDEDKEKVRKMDEELSKLSPKFSQNTLNATNEYTYFTEDKSELSGIPEMVVAQAAETAQKKDKKSGWMFTLQMPSYMPVMQYAENRKLRETMSREFGKISYGGEFDNQDIIKKIVTLRYEKAQILGFDDHADYTLQKRMAGKTDIVMNFLNRLYDVYYPSAQNELDEMRELARKDGVEEMQSWDSAYYSEKLKMQKYDFDQEELRPYFKTENVIEGIFKVAQLMYGLNFKETKEIPIYHEEVRVFEVHEENGDFLSLFYVDLHPRETKNGGAWMTSWRQQGLYKGKIERPLISIVCNLTPSTEEKPSLLTFREVETIFHEFGHALHGMLSKVTYASLASPDVYWDFVELPSQIMENWLGEKETLSLFAKHYETGEIIPDDLIEKIKKSRSFNAGTMGLRQLSFGMLDMAWHTGNPSKVEDVAKFEDEAIEKTRLLPKIKDSTISCQLGHIFAGGYSAGYYSYKWAEALDADAFEYFKENGIFNTVIADSFRKNILEKGNTKPPMDMYVKFRGKEPDPDALLRRDNLI
ncbi:MAG: M3 family metallopeptidase [Candidatus Marinimicrobia bacterium]|jgi:Zn-dependent oligopeptidase|nr:M3 family metallopeptidase [Candidatus Neomarinimicrobiota bacterium]